MINFLSIIRILILTAGVLMSTWKEISESHVVVDENFKVTNHELTKLKKQKESISDLVEYNNELFIAMRKNNLVKINSDGEITQMPVKEWKAISSNERNMLMKAFNGVLYLTNNTNKLFKMESNHEVTKIYEVDESKFIQYLEIFNNELYFTLILEEDLSSLMKMDSNGSISKVLDFSHGVILLELKTFNNHLYFATSNIYLGGSEVNAIDTNGKIEKNIAIIKNQLINHLIEFKNELYISLDDGSLFKMDVNDEVKEIIKRDLTFGSDALVVFKNELYLGTLNKLEKLTKADKIEIVENLPQNITALVTFDDELYIGMIDGYFAKLS